MKQLFLCSYFAGVKDLFRQYASEKQLGNQVLFIPTAGNVEDYRGYIDEALQTFADLGFQVEILDISACDRETAPLCLWRQYFLSSARTKEKAASVLDKRADCGWHGLCGRICWCYHHS